MAIADAALRSLKRNRKQEVRRSITRRAVIVAVPQGIGLRDGAG
jgi:hypothetical protein